MSEHERWYSVDAESARFFLLGEWLEKGAHLGLSPAQAKPVLAEESGQIVSIQYDIGQQELIVVLDARRRRGKHATSGPSNAPAANGRRRVVPSQRTQRKEVVTCARGSLR